MYLILYEKVLNTTLLIGPATELWSSVASVSAAGRKRGRGKIKGRRIMRDLNKGQILGIGELLRNAVG